MIDPILSVRAEEVASGVANGLIPNIWVLVKLNVLML